MIQRYRKKAVIKLATGGLISFVMMIIAAILMENKLENLAAFIFIASNLAGGIIILFGCSDLLKAKGYGSDMMMVFLIPGVCCSMFFLMIAPFVIIFGMKDKTRNNSRR